MTVDQIQEMLTEEQIKKIKDEAIKLDDFWGYDLSDIVIALEKERRKGNLNYYVDFNGTKLYSLDVTMDKAYKECLGVTKKTHDRRMKKIFEDNKKFLEESERRAIYECPKFIEESKKYIHPEKHLVWEKTCKASFRGMYYGYTAKCAIELIKMLEEGAPFKEIEKKIEEQGHSGWSHSITMKYVLDFSSKGPEFFSYHYKKDMTDDMKTYVRDRKELNNRILMGESYEKVFKELRDYKFMSIRIEDETFFNIDTTNGYIIVYDNSNFIGVLGDYTYITGKITDDCISFADFDDHISSSHYCATGKNGYYTGKKTGNYVLQLNTDVGIIRVFVSELDLPLEKELNMEEYVYDVRDSLSRATKYELRFFDDNFDEITDEALKSFKEKLQMKLLNVLKNRINSEEN